MPKSLEELRRRIAAQLREKRNAIIPIEFGARLAAAAADSDGWVWPVAVCKSGWGHAQFLGPEEFAGKPQYIPREVLPQIAVAMNRARFRRRHPLDHEGDGNALPELVAGWVENARVVADEVHADVHLLPTETEMRARLMAARDAGQMELFNVSILAYFRFRLDKIEGREALVAEKLGKVIGLDMCAEPGWGGKFLEMRMAAAGIEAADLVAAELSHDELRSRLYEALRKKFGERDGSAVYWPTEVFDDYMIARGPEGKLYRVSYRLGLDEQPEVGELNEVEVEYVPVAEGVARGAKSSPGGDAGMKTNDGRPQGADRKRKGATMKERIIALLAALATFAQERAEKLRTGLEGMPEADLPKRFEEVVDAFVECANGAYASATTAKNQDPALIARIQAALAELTKTLKENGSDVLVKAQDALAKAEKIQFTNLLETKLRDAKLPEEAEGIVRAHLKDRVVEEAAVDAEIKAVRDAFAKFTKIGQVSDAAPLVVGRETQDKVQLAMDAMMGVKAALEDKNVRPFRGIKEAYVYITGDTDARVEAGLYRVRAAITTASLPDLLLNSMTKRLIQDYMAIGWNGLDRICKFVGVSDFKTQHRVRLGYFPDLAAVAEDGAYQEIANPTDDLIQYAVSKRGNLFTLTEETIRNDDIGKLRAIPERLARTGIRTGKQSVTSLLTTPGNYDGDGVAIFHATHNNLGSLALSDAELDAREILLFNQSELDSGKALELPLDWIIIPIQLKATALQLNNNNDGANSWYSRFGTPGPAPEGIIINGLLADANDWYYGSYAVPFIEVGVLDGADGQPPIPQILLANDPTQGAAFTNDRAQYKVKSVYGLDYIDFRGAGKNVVP